MFRESRNAASIKPIETDIMHSTGTGVYTAQHYNESYIKSQIDDGLEINYNITGTPLSTVPVFETDFAYFAAAAAVEVFCIVVILYTFSGFWRLGRSASFSPVEIAKAFDSPILRDVPCNLNGRRVARCEGDREVRYGLVDEESKIGSLAVDKLTIAETHRVRVVTGERRSLLEYYHLLKAAFDHRRDSMRRRRETRLAREK